MASALREPQRPQPLIKLEMKKTAIILFICLSVNAFSQVVYTKTSDEFNSFHQNVVSAERMLRNDSALQAYAKFTDAFEQYKGNVNPNHYYKAAIACLKIREEFKALSYLEKAITKGYVLDSNEVKVVNFSSPNTKKEFNTNYPQWTATRDANRNHTWEGDLYQLSEEAKKYQNPKYKTATEAYLACLKNKACNKKAPDFVAKYKLVREKQKADSVVVATLLADIKKHGSFPHLGIVDADACKQVKQLFLNYDADKDNKQLNDLLFKALNDGHISPAYYAEIIDRRNVMSGLTPEFYEPITGYEKTIANVMPAANAKRKTIGLHNIILPSKAKKPATTAKPANGKGPAKPTAVTAVDDKLIYKY